MNRRTMLWKALGLMLALSLMACLAALAEDYPLDDAKYTATITTADAVTVTIPADAKAASWDVSLWTMGKSWTRVKDQTVTAAGTVTIAAKGSLSKGLYALRVVQYGEKDVKQTTMQRMVTVYDALPAEGTVTLTLDSTSASTGDG